MESIREQIRMGMGDIDKEMSVLVRTELDLLEKSEGINGKNNLESFYEIWQANKGKKGDKNAINSWTAYCLGMTSQKPSAEGAFLPLRKAFARQGLPDIDTDFDYEHRQDVYDYIIQKYGRDNVGNVGTYGVLKTRSCLTRLIKALDIANAFHKGKGDFVTENVAMVNHILDPLPKGMIAGKMQAQGDDGKLHIIEAVRDAYRYIPAFKAHMDKYPQIMEHAKDVEGVLSTFGIHASGIVLSGTPLSKIAPLRAARRIDYGTQFPYEDLEKIGLIKFDILAIATLTVLRRAVDLIRENYGIELDLENLPLEDKKTLELFRSGRLAGVFQCESYPMQRVMKDIKVDRFEDVCAAIALFRPGPMENIPEYCARKNGDKPIDYFHPSVEPFVKKYLKDTYGIPVYQESLMQICNSLAGFSIADGYTMIKGIGKKKKEIIDQFKDQFIKGCVNNKVPQDVAEQYWEKFIVPSSSYSFNKSHSVAYGLLSFATCYLKANYPEEFACACLNTEILRSNHDKVEMMEKDVQKTMGIKILARSINDCGVEYKIARKKDASAGIAQSEIRPSIICKGLGLNVAKNIAENQPFKNVVDLAERTSNVTTESLNSLIDSSYFKGKRGINRKDEIVAEFVKIKKAMKKAASKGLPRIDLFGDEK